MSDRMELDMQGDTGAIVFMDTETMGLAKEAPIWEFAAVRRNNDGTEETYHWFVHHNPHKHLLSGLRWVDEMAEPFKSDYQKRYDPNAAIHPADLVGRVLPHIYRGRAHTIGAVPSFDTERLELLCKQWGEQVPWHYHLVDVENVVVGFLAGRGRLILPPWKSDELSACVGVNAEHFNRHTAMGDVLWEMAQWDAVMFAEPEPEYFSGMRDCLGDIPAMVRGLVNGQLTWREIPNELRDWWNGFIA